MFFSVSSVSSVVEKIKSVNISGYKNGPFYNFRFSFNVLLFNRNSPDRFEQVPDKRIDSKEAKVSRTVKAMVGKPESVTNGDSHW